MEEELTEKMHEEFTVSKETELMHKAMCIWCYGIYKTEEEQKEAAKSYGISWEDALRLKDECLPLADGNGLNVPQITGSNVPPIK